MNKRPFFAEAALFCWATAGTPAAQAAPCMIVTLKGKESGPPAFNGLGAETLVRYGDDAKHRRRIKGNRCARIRTCVRHNAISSCALPHSYATSPMACRSGPAERKAPQGRPTQVRL
jgi:hypothetical protein